MMRYLLDEVEEEVKYTENYKEAEELAEKEAEKYNKNKRDSENKKYCWNFMPEKYSKAPKKQFVKSRMRLIRELALKCYEA